jgi:hypothetical protein
MPAIKIWLKITLFPCSRGVMLSTLPQTLENFPSNGNIGEFMLDILICSEKIPIKMQQTHIRNMFIAKLKLKDLMINNEEIIRSRAQELM